MILTDKFKSVLDDLAKEVRSIYQFSLIPTSENYKDIETIANDLGGGVIYYNGLDTEVCRCGTSFIIKIPNKKETTKLRCFAEGLAILFLDLNYLLSNERFMKHENMSYKTIYQADYEYYKALIYLMEEFLCPQEELKKAVLSILKMDGTFPIKELVPLLGFSYSYIEARLIQCKMIQHNI